MTSATKLPIADSLSRAGSRLMSTDWLPITRLRSGAVSSLAFWMIAWTSARGATPRFLASRVEPPAQATSPPFTSSWRTEYDAPALTPSVIRMCPRIRFETRWVWPTTIASTVVLWSSSAIPRIGPSHGAPAALPIGFRPREVPSWITTTWTFTPCLRSRSDSALIRGPSSRNASPSVAPAFTSSGVLSSSAPITPTLMPLTVNTFDGVTHGGVSPVSSSTMLVARNGKFARAWWASSRSRP